MTHKRPALAVLSATFLAAATLAADAAAQYQKQCKPAMTNIGQHKVKKLARRIAKQGWGQQAQAAYGASWAKLQNAAVSQNGCSLDHPNWTCVFTAKPCRLVNPDVSPNQPGLQRLMKPNL
ncbi:hypothetical protein GN330_12810 [Nitratireductor sp. CAU 1489]|uniref:Uncharacterized protein n=1 Tax=Nitratireductor arenosus TaxID=2682096 RepID=A0A844QHN2_9HYPH|nr:hypothetical protein [Nitratireductor arenosus]MVA98124.1 hypothetical protein [Nitratireductor arenosus]